MVLVDSGSLSGVARKSTDVLSPRWKRHNIPVAVSKWNLSITLPHWPIRHLLTNEFPVSLSLRLVVFSTLYCYINVRFLKYFLHNLYLVWFCDNPLPLYVWEEAKIWTQGTLHALLSHFCSIVSHQHHRGISTALLWAPPVNTWTQAGRLGKKKKVAVTGSACVFPSAPWQDLFIVIDKSIIVSMA